MISKDLCKPTPQTKGIRIIQAGEGQEPQNSPSDIVFWLFIQTISQLLSRSKLQQTESMKSVWLDSLMRSCETKQCTKTQPEEHNLFLLK